jgi:hypothetical protein
MLRRAVFTAGVVFAVSAVGALAFATDLSRVGRALTGGAAWPWRSFTPVPAPVEKLKAATGPVRQTSDFEKGAYCPFPTQGGPTHSAGERPSLTATAPDSTRGLVLQGESAIPRSDSAAVCTGTQPGATPKSPLIVP